jgi:hypothetical protein
MRAMRAGAGAAARTPQRTAIATRTLLRPNLTPSQLLLRRSSRRLQCAARRDGVTSQGDQEGVKGVSRDEAGSSYNTACSTLSLAGATAAVCAFLFFWGMAQGQCATAHKRKTSLIEREAHSKHAHCNL